MATAKPKTTKSNAKPGKAKRKASNNVFRPGTDLVASMAEEFKKKVTAMVGKENKNVTIDLAGVDVVDSVGLGLVIATHNSLRHQGGELKVINASNDVFQLFKTMRLDQHFEVQPV